MLKLLFAWPFILLSPRRYGAGTVVGALLVVAASLSLAWWLGGGDPVRTAAYAGALLLLPPLTTGLFLVALVKQ